MVKRRSKSSRSGREVSENCGYYSEKSPKMSEYCGYYSEKSPQFFKIYVPHHSSRSVRIPPAFIKHFKGNLPSKSILRTPAKRSWRIDMNKVDNNFFFLKGWPEFVRDNSLVFGDFLIFYYTGNMEYYVTIFGKNNCQKEVLITATDDDEPQPLRQWIQTDGTCKSEERMCIDSVEMSTSMPVPDNIGALETPSELGTKKPSFEIVLKPTYVHSSSIFIPSKFQKSYINEPRATARLQYGNKSWVVNMRPYKHSRLVFSVGWSKFVKQNSLQVGDFCSFELIEKENYVFKVSISRGKSEEIECLNSGEEGTKRTVEANVEDASTKFISKHPFFQIVLTPACMRYILGIPSKFQKSYINEPRATATLQYSNKRWVVNLITYKDGRLIFSGGWSKFMTQNSLQVGDVCSFELIEKENYVFTVSISRGKSKEIGGLEDAFDKFTSKHPFFHVVLSPSSVSRHLCIPSKFWTSYIDQPRATARLQCSNQWWMVGLRGYGHGSYFLGGWSKFAKENSLQVGDDCCFELIEKNYVFKVSIDRGINNSTPTKA